MAQNFVRQRFIDNQFSASKVYKIQARVGHFPIRFPEPVQVVQPVGAEHDCELHESRDVWKGLNQPFR